MVKQFQQDSKPNGRQHSAFLRAINTAASAAIAGTLSEIAFYGLDSYKFMMQMEEKANMRRLFRGTLPLALIGAGPSYAAFFFCYNPVRNMLNEKLGAGKESISVLISSVVAGIPSTLVYVPADVVKKQLLLTPSSSSGQPPSAFGIARQQYRQGGISQMYLGWQANLLRDAPLVMLKMSLYEGIARLYLRTRHREKKKEVVSADHLSSLEASGVGFASGALTAIATCPIDCVNSRIKSGEFAELSVFRAHVEIVRADGASALFRGVLPRAAILGLGSTVFWYLQTTFMHMLSNHNNVII